jgi:hypothetical protein
VPRWTPAPRTGSPRRHLAAFFDATRAAALLIRSGAEVDAVADTATRVAADLAAAAGHDELAARPG